jgi:hypothetical protein
MRAIWFMAGWLTACCLWVVFDIYGRHPPPPPSRVRNVGDQAVAPPPMQYEPLAETPAPTKRHTRPTRPSALEDERVMAATTSRADAEDDEPWSSKHLLRPVAPEHTLTTVVARGRRWPELAVTLGVGSEGFLLSSGGRPAGSAQTLDLRLLLSPRGVFGAEAAYLGAFRDDGLTSTLEIVGRWHPYPQRKARPFVLGGAAWRHEHGSSEDALAIPLGAGLSFSKGSWYGDARFTARPTPGRDLHTVGLSARVGATF